MTVLALVAFAGLVVAAVMLWGGWAAVFVVAAVVFVFAVTADGDTVRQSLRRKDDDK